MAFWEFCFSECPSSNKGHSGKQYSQNAVVSEQGGILPRMPWFPNRGHSEKQYSQNAMVSKQGAFCTQNVMVSVSSVSLLSKNTFHLGKSGTNQLIMLKLHLFPRDSWKDAVLGPPKLPSGLRPLGSFGGPRPASFQESLGKRRNFGPKF